MTYLLPSTPILEETQKEFYANLLDHKLEIVDILDELFDLETFPWVRRPDYWPRFHDPRASLTQLLSAAYKALSMIRYELLKAITEDKVDKRWYAPGVIPPPSPPNPLPPMASQIPLLTTMPLPPPFSKNSMKSLEEYGIASTCAPEFITAGSWTRYCMTVTGNGAVSATSDIPMSEVQFSVVENGTDGLEFRSNGDLLDITGPFSLCLRTFPRAGAGKFELVRVYSSGGGR
jgi:hypothetical protein